MEVREWGKGKLQELRAKGGSSSWCLACICAKLRVAKLQDFCRGSWTPNVAYKLELPAGEPTGYDYTDLIAIIKHHKPDVLIGAPWLSPGISLEMLASCCLYMLVLIEAVGRVPNCFNKAVVEAMLEVQKDKPGGRFKTADQQAAEGSMSPSRAHRAAVQLGIRSGS